MNISDEYLRCRSLRHAWDEHTPIDGTAPHWGVAIYWRCIRCAGVRRDVVSMATGDLLSRTYQMPEGYGYAHRDERPSAADFRLELARRRKPRAARARAVPGRRRAGTA